MNRSSLARAIGTILTFSAMLAGTAHAAPKVIDLETLNGTQGIKLNDLTPGSSAGNAVNGAGDINGDGSSDLIIADPRLSNAEPARSFVVFGASGGLSSPLDLSGLNGSNGFKVDAEAAGDALGSAIGTAGDFNGDGVDDFIIGARGADWIDTNAGRSYLIYGKTNGFASTLSLSGLIGSAGFKLDGELANDGSGQAAAAAGDINGDGLGDLVIGAGGSDVSGNASGRSYVVFGRSAQLASTLLLADLDGSNGFKLNGEFVGDLSGAAAAAAHDVNGDGLDDLIVGAYFADPSGPDSGRSYVVYGRSSGFTSPMPMAGIGGSSGFKLDGEAGNNFAGHAVSAAGDFNGDGIGDFLVGAPGTDTDLSASAADAQGRSYVIFGTAASRGAPLPLSSLDGSNGFMIDGQVHLALSGTAISAAGDVNGDGLDDIIIGAAGLNQSYVLFGRRSPVQSPLPLSNVDASVGITLAGISTRTGSSVAAAGDVNGDGTDDVILGAPDLSRSYVVYGARDQIFRDGNEPENIVDLHPRMDARRTAIGSGVRWQTGAKCNCNLPAFDFNMHVSAGNLVLDWPGAGVEGGVATGAVYQVLAPGAVVGPASSFSTDSSATASSDWRASNGGYLGFRFVNSNTGMTNYGYVQISTTAPNGYPARIVRIGYNQNGGPVTIPQP